MRNPTVVGLCFAGITPSPGRDVVHPLMRAVDANTLSGFARSPYPVFWGVKKA
jgi:hypothetical protein